MPIEDPRPGKSASLMVLAFTAAFVIGGAAAHATEGGGSQYGLGAATILPGVQPTPPGLNIVNYNLLYVADRLNNARGEKAIPNFHVDLLLSFVKLDYSFHEPIGGVRFGMALGVPLLRANVSTGRGATAFHQEKTGMGDIGITPLVAGWEFDTPVGHVNQHAKVVINPPTGDYRATDRVNLGRNYTAYIWHFGNSLFPTDLTHLGFQLVYVSNTKNSATNYQSGSEFDLTWSGGFDLTPDLSAELNGYFYKQVTNDYRAGILVNGDGNKGQAVGIGPQFRLKLHPGAITLKWQTEMAVRNRPQGNRFWLQFYHPL